MAKIPFVGGNYEDRSLPLDSQVTQNLFPAVDKIRNATCMYKVPGLASFWDVVELVTNGGFETLGSWSPSGDYGAWGRTLSMARTGSFSMRVLGGSLGDRFYVYQILSGLEINMVYRAIAWVRGSGLTSGDFTMSMGNQTFNTQSISNGAWVKLEGTLAWDGVSNGLVIGVWSPTFGNPAGVIYIDDVSCQIGAVD